MQLIYKLLYSIFCNLNLRYTICEHDTHVIKYKNEASLIFIW